MAEAEKLKCPACGAEMNHHADKPDYGSAADEAAPGVFDGVAVIEVHTCPDCGRTETRPARARGL